MAVGVKVTVGVAVGVGGGGGSRSVPFNKFVALFVEKWLNILWLLGFHIQRIQTFSHLQL